jgi:hypothetical protein
MIMTKNIHDKKKIKLYYDVKVHILLLFMIMSSRHFKSFKKRLSSENINYIAFKMFLSTIFISNGFAHVTIIYLIFFMWTQTKNLQHSLILFLTLKYGKLNIGYICCSVC